MQKATARLCGRWDVDHDGTKISRNALQERNQQNFSWPGNKNRREANLPAAREKTHRLRAGINQPEVVLAAAGRHVRGTRAVRAGVVVPGRWGQEGRALQLAFLRGWTHAESASAVGEPLGTVKARIRRGLLALRKIMKDYDV